jgi:serine/threonine protein kinase
MGYQNQDPKQRYSLVKNLGRGGYGDVSLYYDNIFKREVVIKRIIKSGKNEELQFFR